MTEIILHCKQLLRILFRRTGDSVRIKKRHRSGGFSLVSDVLISYNKLELLDKNVGENRGTCASAWALFGTKSHNIQQSVLHHFRHFNVSVELSNFIGVKYWTIKIVLDFSFLGFWRITCRNCKFWRGEWIVKRLRSLWMNLRCVESNRSGEVTVSSWLSWRLDPNYIILAGWIKDHLGGGVLPTGCLMTVSVKDMNKIRQKKVRQTYLHLPPLITQHRILCAWLLVQCFCENIMNSRIHSWTVIRTILWSYCQLNNRKWCNVWL